MDRDLHLDDLGHYDRNDHPDLYENAGTPKDTDPLSQSGDWTDGECASAQLHGNLDGEGGDLHGELSKGSG